jgi:hypothetical protein
MQDMMRREDECGDLPTNGASGGIITSAYHSRSVMWRRAAQGDPVAAAMLDDLAKGIPATPPPGGHDGPPENAEELFK